MIEELKAASFFPEWKEKEFIDPSNPISSQVETVFQGYRAKAIEKDLISDKTDEQGMVWGIENLNDLNGYRWICSKDNVFPQRTLAFEGVACKAPSNIDKFLTEVYGDIYRLPRDMGTHCPHVSPRTNCRAKPIRRRAQLTKHSSQLPKQTPWEAARRQHFILQRKLWLLS